MPIYEYHCQACNHDFEVLQKVNEADISLCPNCQSKTVKRLVSAAGFQLKGTGWYETDFKNKPKSTPMAASNESKKESTPAPKVEATTNPKSPSVKGQDK